MKTATLRKLRHDFGSVFAWVEQGEPVGISKRGNVADVDFVWKWVALNEVGAALYATDARYVSTVGFREYDDGWRVMQTNPRAGQSLNDALDSAEPSK